MPCYPDGYIQIKLLECEIDGRWVPYNLCATTKDSYHDTLNKKYLGCSNKYKADGRESTFEDKMHFWQRTKS